jgi:hypothetical protein
LLQENAALRKAQDALQLQATRLQQQLSSERQSAQVAAAAAAAERSKAGRAVHTAQQRLAAAVQRLAGVAAREQRQQAVLQQVCHAQRISDRQARCSVPSAS